MDTLRQVQPDKIYVIADGPRSHVPPDLEKTKAVRLVIEEGITWKCSITKIYAESNMSGPIRVPSAFQEIFLKEEQVIILEDDCIPSVSFFRYCDELLEKYALDTRVGTICGFNLSFTFLGRPKEGNRPESYFFSKYPASWGWATWRRVWDQFDKDLDRFPEIRIEGKFDNISDVTSVQDFWIKKFTDLHLKNKRNWDYRLTYSLILNNLLSVIPSRNLVSNIGADGSGANYNQKIKDYVSNKRTHEIEFPLVHPTKVQLDKDYDRQVGWHFFTTNKWGKLMRLVRNYLTYFRII